MADPGKNAITTYAHDGGRRSYVIGFDFLDQNDVVVLIGVDEMLLGVDYEIVARRNRLTFLTGRATTAGTLVLRRQSKRSGLPDGAAGNRGLAPVLAFTPVDGRRAMGAQLARIDRQLRFYLEEVEDQTGGISPQTVAVPAITATATVPTPQVPASVTVAVPAIVATAEVPTPIPVADQIVAVPAITATAEVPLQGAFTGTPAAADGTVYTWNEASRIQIGVEHCVVPFAQGAWNGVDALRTKTSLKEVQAHAFGEQWPDSTYRYAFVALPMAEFTADELKTTEIEKGTGTAGVFNLESSVEATTVTWDVIVGAETISVTADLNDLSSWTNILTGPHLRRYQKVTAENMTAHVLVDVVIELYSGTSHFRWWLRVHVKDSASNSSKVTVDAATLKVSTDPSSSKNLTLHGARTIILSSGVGFVEYDLWSLTGKSYDFAEGQEPSVCGVVECEEDAAVEPLRSVADWSAAGANSPWGVLPAMPSGYAIKTSAAAEYASFPGLSSILNEETQFQVLRDPSVQGRQNEAFGPVGCSEAFWSNPYILKSLERTMLCEGNRATHVRYPGTAYYAHSSDTSVYLLKEQLFNLGPLPPTAEWFGKRQGTVVVQSGTDSGSDFVINDGTTLAQAQSFTSRAGKRERLVSASFRLKIGAGTPTGQITVEISAADAAGLPTGAVLATSNARVINASDLALTSIYITAVFTFSSGFVLEDATKYAAILRHGAGTAANNVVAEGATTGSVASENRSALAASWTAASASDLWHSVVDAGDILAQKGYAGGGSVWIGRDGQHYSATVEFTYALLTYDPWVKQEMDYLVERWYSEARTDALMQTHFPNAVDPDVSRKVGRLLLAGCYALLWSGRADVAQQLTDYVDYVVAQRNLRQVNGEGPLWYDSTNTWPLGGSQQNPVNWMSPWMDSIGIMGLHAVYKLTGHAPALQLAKEVAGWVLRNHVQVDGGTLEGATNQYQYFPATGATITYPGTSTAGVALSQNGLASGTLIWTIPMAIIGKAILDPSHPGVPFADAIIAWAAANDTEQFNRWKAVS